MLQKVKSTALLMGAMLAVSIPGVALAQNHGGSGHGGYSRGGTRGQSYGGVRSYAAPRGYSGGEHFVSPRGYYGGSYVVPRSYGRPVYRGYYGGGAYFGYGYPYGYAYAPGYAYVSGYAYGPAPQPCTDGAYDQYGNWVPNPACYAGQGQYPQSQQGYDPNQYPQQQYPQQPQQNYYPNQQPYNR
jgi:hypothetical protein